LSFFTYKDVLGKHCIKNQSSVDIAAEDAAKDTAKDANNLIYPITVKPKKEKNLLFTPIVFPTLDQIFWQLQNDLKDFLHTDLMGIIGGYVVFAMDLSWCDPNPYIYLEKKYPGILRHMGPSNNVKVSPDQMERTVNDQDFVKKFQIDQKQGVDDITMRRINHCGDRDETIFSNMISFNVPDLKAPDIVIFEFPLSDLKTLIKTKDCEELTQCVDKIFAEGETRHRLNEKWVLRKQKMELLWECWRKIIAPKYVLENLNTLTGFRFGIHIYKNVNSSTSTKRFFYPLITGFNVFQQLG
jgi:hypothetical protein